MGLMPYCPLPAARTMRKYGLSWVWHHWQYEGPQHTGVDITIALGKDIFVSYKIDINKRTHFDWEMTAIWLSSSWNVQSLNGFHTRRYSRDWPIQNKLKSRFSPSKDTAPQALLARMRVDWPVLTGSLVGWCVHRVHKRWWDATEVKIRWR